MGPHFYKLSAATLRNILDIERDGSAGAGTGAGFAQAVELEGMGVGAERQRGFAGIEPPI